MDTDGTAAGPPATVRCREGLVQIEVHDVEADVTRTEDPHVGVEVGAINVDKAAPPMYNLSDFGDVALK